MIHGVAKHMSDVLSQTRIVSDPFPHFYAEGIFPQQFYNDLLRALPPTACYSIMPTTKGQRFSAELEPAWIETLPKPIAGLWAEIEALLSSQELLDSVVEKFADSLAKTRQLRVDQLTHAISGRLPVAPRVLLARDMRLSARGLIPIILLNLLSASSIWLKTRALPISGPAFIRRKIGCFVTGRRNVILLNSLKRSRHFPTVRIRCSCLPSQMLRSMALSLSDTMPLSAT